MTVEGHASDSLSGLGRVTCDGTAAVISGSGFGCAAALDEGVNDIRVEAADLAGNMTTASLHVIRQTGPVGDGDGVAEAVEDRAPNGGDGNNDGIADSEQENAASLPNGVDGRYVTLESWPGTTLVQVEVVPTPSPASVLDGAELPLGLFSFEVHGIAPGEDTTLTSYLPTGVGISSFHKYGPTPDDPAPHWYDFAFDGTTGALVLPDRIVLTFVDGQRGDDDLLANGVIVDQGGPASGACRTEHDLARGQAFRCSLPLGPDGSSWSTASMLPPGLGIVDEGGRWFIDGTLTVDAPLESYPAAVDLTVEGNPIDSRHLVFHVSLPFSVWTQNAILRPEDLLGGTVSVAAVCLASTITGHPVLVTLCHLWNVIEAKYDADVKNTNQDNEERTRLVLDRLPRHDIVALQETFDEPRLEQLIDDTTTHFVIPGPEGESIADIPTKASSGLALAIRRGLAPLLQQASDALAHEAQVYEDCFGELTDCLANKGFTLDTVHLGADPDAYVYVVNTHLNAEGDPGSGARFRQLMQLQDFLDDNSDSHHPIVLLGDFNVIETANEYNDLLNVLELDLEDDLYREFGPVMPSARSTADPERNAYSRFWFPPEPGEERHHERLDYVLVRQGSVYRVDTDFIFMTDEVINTTHCINEGWVPDPDLPDLQCYLSDHFGIAANLRLTKQPPVRIALPDDGATFLEGQEVELIAPFRPDLTNRTAVWTSDVVGGIASDTIGTWTAEEVGPHVLTVVLTDASGVTGTDSVSITVLPDRDRDGLSDDDELTHGTDPDNPDTDGDGLLDGAEVAAGANPLNPDSDGDSLEDGEEVNPLGTDPTLADSDGDGVEDGAEMVLGTDPNLAASVPNELPPGTLLASSPGPGGSHLVVVDPSNGRLGRLGRPNGGLGFGLAFDAAATLYIGQGSRLGTHEPLDDVTGEVAPFQDALGNPVSVTQLAFNPIDGRLYGVEEGPAPDFLPTDQLVRIEPGTAEITRVGSPGAVVRSLTFTRDGVLYAALEDSSSTDRLVQLDPATGAVIQDVGLIGFTPVSGLAITRGDTFYASLPTGADEGRLLTIDPVTGAGTEIATFGRPLFDLTDQPCPAPCLTPAGGSQVFGLSPFALVITDLDGDSTPDALVPDGSVAGINVYLGDGTGGFDLPKSVTSDSPVDLAVADFDRDSFLDVVAVNGAPARHTVSVHFGDGTGALGPAVVTGVPGQPRGIAAGDVNGDGFGDVAVITGEDVTLLFGDGSGAFPTSSTITGLFSAPRAILLVDVDGDLLLDLIVANTGATDGVSVLLGDGSGGFALAGNFAAGVDPFSLASGHLDQDAHLDLVVTAARRGSNEVQVLMGNGDGTFEPPVSFGTDGEATHHAAVGDVTGEGNADIVTANHSSISVLVGDGLGEFNLALSSPYPTPCCPAHVGTADLDGDSLEDVVGTDVEFRRLFILLNEPPF